jgi:hypothetical protein
MKCKRRRTGKLLRCVFWRENCYAVYSGGKIAVLCILAGKLLCCVFWRENCYAVYSGGKIAALCILAGKLKQSTFCNRVLCTCARNVTPVCLVQAEMSQRKLVFI